MSPIVRGNKLFVVYVPPVGNAHGVCKGDHLWVASRTKNGWLRVKNERTQKVTSLRSGPWVLKLASNWGRQPALIESPWSCWLPQPPAAWLQEKPVAAFSWLQYDGRNFLTQGEEIASQPQAARVPSIDQLIRESQIEKLEAANESANERVQQLEAELDAVRHTSDKSIRELELSLESVLEHEQQLYDTMQGKLDALERAGDSQRYFSKLYSTMQCKLEAAEKENAELKKTNKQLEWGQQAAVDAAMRFVQPGQSKSIAEQYFGWGGDVSDVEDL